MIFYIYISGDVFSLASTSKVVFFTGRKLFGVMFKNLVWCELLLNCNPSTWLNRLNNETKYGGVPFYILIPDLLQETDIFEHSVRDDDLERVIQRKYTILEKVIQTARDKYMEGEVTTSHLLMLITGLYK